MEDKIVDVLADINRNLERIATALESWNNAAIRDADTDSDGHVEIFVTNHEA